MSLHFAAQDVAINDSDSGSSQSSEDEQDLTWEDWVSDSLENKPCKSLFDYEKTLQSVTEALSHDKSAHGVDLDAICSKLSLDLYQRIRLINWIRKEKPSPSEVIALKGDESLFSSDEYLIPAVEDDPLLQLTSADWSTSDEDEPSGSAPTDLEAAKRRICALERKLKKTQQDYNDYRAFVGERLGRSRLVAALEEPASASSTRVAAPLHDDDSHYFQSYGENDIHAVMIQDKVRTASYAQFIQSNPELFNNAVVLDVGCGTGILSLFAARAGARRVIAVDASQIAEKAEQIVKDNGLENVVTVIRGRVEDIKLPDGLESVDVIVSEWMGYGLLYESMLDSVLHARDRFLRKDGGVMAPSQCKMQLCLCEGGDIFKERIGFWGDVYGFDLSAMGTDVYEDAIVDVVGPETVLSEPCTIKDLPLGSITPKQLDFSAPFTLTTTTLQRTKAHALTLYFDTFFTADGAPVAPGTRAHAVREGDPVLAEVWPLGGRHHITRRMSSGQGLKDRDGDAARRKLTSFSTGPESVPTHWKQTLFLLKEPITVHEGTVVQGTFKCRKSADNSRELDVEIHYTVKDPDTEEPPSEVVVQLYKVR